MKSKYVENLVLIKTRFLFIIKIKELIGKEPLFDILYP